MARVLATDSANASALNDLAVALMARLPYRGDPADLLVSVDLLERAARIDSLSSVIAFNRARALGRAYLVEESRAMWRRYLTLERDVGWREEGERRMTELTAFATMDSSRGGPRTTSPGALVHASSQKLRETIIDSLLPEWAMLVQGGNASAANSVLDDALAMSDALAKRAGDSTALMAVREVVAASRHQGLATRVATQLKRYGDGRRALSRDRFGDAKAVAQTIPDSETEWPALSLCLGELRGTLDVFFSDYARAERRFDRITSSALTRPMRALRARSHWARALANARQGRLGASERDYSLAAAIYDSIGERTNRSTVESERSDVLFLLGQEEAATRAMLSSLASLDIADASARHSALGVMGMQVSDAGLPYAAAAIRREMLWWAGRTRRPRDVVQSLARLAMDEVAIGDTSEAQEHLRRAREAIGLVTDSAAEARLRVDLARAGASLDRDTDVPRAVEQLSVVDEYLLRKGISIERIDVLIERAQLRLRLADTTRAERDLAVASMVAESLVVADLDPGVLRSARDARHRVFHLLVEIDLARGDSLAAFRHASRSRALVTARQGRLDAASRVPPGTVALSYAVLPSTVVCWLVTREGVRQRVVPVREDSLERLVARFTDALQRDDTAMVKLVGATLARLLLPEALYTRPSWRETVVVPDGPLARLAFAALPIDSTRHLVELGVIRYAETVGGVRDSPAMRRKATRQTRRTLLVGVPTVDRGLFPDLPDLAGVTTEIEAIAGLHPDAMQLHGSAATRSAVMRAMSSARAMHFAGHAKLAVAMPERSQLVLAHDSTARSGIEADVLFAADIARLDLSALRLVILSSCGTVQPSMRRPVSARGLAEAFLDAGAAGVVSGLWEAEDGSTSELMVRMHRAYERSSDGAAALQVAQLELLRNDRARPSRWSAFRYQGQ